VGSVLGHDHSTGSMRLRVRGRGVRARRALVVVLDGGGFMIRRTALGVGIGVNGISAVINILSSSGALLDEKPGMCLVYGALAVCNALAVQWLADMWRQT
jgi:F420-0:gamma-glutamyl ligase